MWLLLNVSLPLTDQWFSSQPFLMHSNIRTNHIIREANEITKHPTTSIMKLDTDYSKYGSTSFPPSHYPITSFSKQLGRLPDYVAVKKPFSSPAFLTMWSLKLSSPHQHAPLYFFTIYWSHSSKIIQDGGNSLHFEMHNLINYTLTSFHGSMH